MRWVVVLLVLAGLAGGGWWLARRATPKKRTWETETLGRGELVLKVSAAGTIEPNLTVKVGSQVSGIVKEVRVQANDRVTKDQILALLDRELLDREYKDRVNALNLAQIRLDQLTIEEENLKLKEEALRIREERLKVDRQTLIEQLKLAKQNLTRYEEMRKGNATGQMEVDARRLLAIEKTGQLALLDIEVQDIAKERRQIASDRKAIDLRHREAKISVEKAETAVDMARVNLEYATIKSPIEGVVLERLVEPGQTIAASFQTPNLFELAADLKHLRIQAQVDEADAVRIRDNQDATFEVDAFRGETFTGRVDSVRLKHIARGNAISYPVIVEAENPQVEGFRFGKLRPGMTAYLTFEVGRRTALRLPVTALRFAPPEGTPVDRSAEAKKPESRKGGGPHRRSGTVKDAVVKPSEAPRGMKATVYLSGEKGLRAVSVRVGDCDGEFYELLDDKLKEGDKVVTGLGKDKPEKTRDGDKTDGETEVEVASPE
jgi:HlyD family secretion protein